MGRFEGRGVVVTGAAQGMGRAIAEAFVAEGARVVLSDLNEEGVVKTSEELGQNGNTFPVRCDVTKADDVESLVAGAVEHLGAVDVFVNNAGTITMRQVVELGEDEWDLVMDVNAKGVFLCTRAILPHMLERVGCDRERRVTSWQARLQAIRALLRVKGGSNRVQQGCRARGRSSCADQLRLPWHRQHRHDGTRIRVGTGGMTEKRRKASRSGGCPESRWVASRNPSTSPASHSSSRRTTLAK